MPSLKASSPILAQSSSLPPQEKPLKVEMIAILILKNDTVEKYCKRKLEDFSNRRKENVRDSQIQKRR